MEKKHGTGAPIPTESEQSINLHSLICDDLKPVMDKIICLDALIFAAACEGGILFESTRSRDILFGLQGILGELIETFDRVYQAARD